MEGNPHIKENPAYQNEFSRLKAIVLIPTFNNAGSLAAVLRDVLNYTHNILVVNDGSTDSTSEILKNFPQVQQIGYEKNQGKGYALRKGFVKARQLDYDFVITLDADGQHYGKDLPLLLSSIEKYPNTIVIGARNLNQENVPGKSSFGNRFSNFWFWLYTGKKAPDTQSGYRLYPVKEMEKIRFYTRKYEFEVEVLVRSAWNGLDVQFVPISVYYPPADERVSHFRPFRDFSRISVLNTVLFFIAFLYIKPRNFFRALFSREKRAALLNELLESQQSAERKAASIGFGVFMGIVPIWGFQLIVAIFLSILLKLNKALVITAANISIPPMIPFILYGSFLAGAPWMGDEASAVPLPGELSLDSIKVNLQQYISGSITLALVAGALFGIISYIFMKLMNKKTSAVL